MLVTTETRNVQVSPAKQRQRVSLKASADAVRRFILPYSNLAYAAVRETIQNAADASRRIHIQAPSLIDARFVARDEGPGIPGDYLASFFSVAGHSTKRGTNTNDNGDDLMGHGGIGRFAPLCVTDQMFVRSWQGGICTTVSVYFDEENYPVVDIIDSSPSNEHSGLEVSFAIDPKKINEFRQAIADTLRFFPDHFEINWLGEPVPLDKPVAKFQGNGWWYVGEGISLVVMGRVAYELDTYGAHTHDSPLREGIILTVPMGSVKVTDSREGLVYNDTTRQTIRDRLKEIETEFVDTASAQLDSCTTMWEATAKAHILGDYRMQRLFASKPLKWKGKEVAGYLDYNSKQQIGHFSRYTLTKHKRPKLQYTTNLHIDATKTLVLINDLKTKTVETLKYNLFTIGDDVSHFVIVPADAAPTVLPELGDPPHTYMSTLTPVPKAPPRPRGTATHKPVRMKRYNENTQRWEDADVDTKQPAIYYTTVNGYPDRALPFSVGESIDTHILTRSSVLPIVEVPKSVAHHLKKAVGWVHITDQLAADAPVYAATNAYTLSFRKEQDKIPYGYTPNDDYRLWNDTTVLTFLFPQLDLTVNPSSRVLEYLKGKDDDSFAKAITKLVDDKPLIRYLIGGGIPDDKLLAYLKA